MPQLKASYQKSLPLSVPAWRNTSRSWCICSDT